MKAPDRKQIVALSLVVMILVAAVLQYTYKKVSQGDRGKIGEPAYVENTDLEALNGTDSQSVQDSSFPASKEANDFFAQAKLDREMTRSENEERLKEIANDSGASQEIKKQAYEKMMELVQKSETELLLETLIKDRGYADAIVLIGEGKTIDIIVKAPSLTKADVAKIADLAIRHTGSKMTDIHITNKY